MPFTPPAGSEATSTAPFSLKPLQTPPVIGHLPALSGPKRKPFFDGYYSLSTHVLPAAYPRTAPYQAPPTLPAVSLPKEERKAGLNAVTAQVLRCQTKYAKGQVDDERSSIPLWLCVNRYHRKQLSKESIQRVTVLLTHAIGFPKETWEPTLQNLLAGLGVNSLDPVIEEIWSLEAVQHGDSGTLNTGNLSCLFNWADYARDALHFLLHYLPEISCAAGLPTHLTRLPEDVTRARLLNGFAQRTVVAIGHSFGGAALVMAAHEAPRIFSSLVIVDPPIAPNPPMAWFMMAVKGTLSRRNRWPTRALAVAQLQSLPYFATWSPAVLHTYAQYAIIEDTSGVRLKTDVVLEACAYDTQGPRQAWSCLPSIDPNVSLHWIMSNTKSPWGGSRANIPKRRAENVSSCFMDAGHLIPMEKPHELAEELAIFLRKKYGAGVGLQTARL